MSFDQETWFYFFLYLQYNDRNVQDSMAWHKFNIRYRYYFIPLYIQTLLGFFFKFLVGFHPFWLQHIHIPTSQSSQRFFAHMTHNFLHAITSDRFPKENKTNIYTEQDAALVTQVSKFCSLLTAIMIPSSAPLKKSSLKKHSMISFFGTHSFFPSVISQLNSSLSEHTHKHT